MGIRAVLGDSRPGGRSGFRCRVPRWTENRGEAGWSGLHRRSSRKNLDASSLSAIVAEWMVAEVVISAAEADQESGSSETDCSS